jgi:hypothetical protein
MPLPISWDDAVQAAEKAARWGGLQRLKKLVLQHRKGAAVNGLGFDFFPDRESLIKKYGTLGRRF